MSGVADKAGLTLQAGPTAAELPRVSFVLPVLNGGLLLERCLAGIVAQDYPRERIEIIVADGGSTDDSVAIARRHGARVVPNPRKLAEPGVELGMREASGEYLVVLAADNGLPTPAWTRQMLRPFLDEPRVTGAFTQIVPHGGDNAFTRYYCRLHVEPFTWYVYGDASNPRTFHRVYPVAGEGEGWVAYAFTPLTHPLVALAQGFMVRRSFVESRTAAEDDIVPIIRMIERGEWVAYVPTAGVYHHHLNSFGHFIRKYRWRVHNSLYGQGAGFDSRGPYLTRTRKARKYLFEPYGLLLLGPLLDALRLWWRERDACMLWHAPASTGLAALIAWEWLGARIARARKPDG